MKRLGTSLSIALLMQAGSVFAARDTPSTVGDVAEDNGLQQNGWAIVKTPSVLRIEMSESLPADVDTAIAHYDRILELPMVDPALRAEAMRRAAYLRVQRADAGAGKPDDATRAIAIYRQLLQENPEDAGNDRALYQLARAYQIVGDTDASIDQLQRLGQRYPQSALTGDGVFRVAELLYARGRYAEAERNYRTVLDLGSNTRYFQPAEYKYGWAIYQQARYPQAIAVFFGILERELPAGEVADAEPAFAAVKKNRLEVAQDSLRVASLSFAALGGGQAINDYFARVGEPRFATLVYRATGSLLIDKQRYTDAAATYGAFVARHPGHALAPGFQTQVIAAYQQGGFGDLVLQAKERYAQDYAPGASYWTGRAPNPAVLAQVRTHMDDIAHHYQALAQNTPANDSGARHERFLTAANWYERTLTLFPQDAKAGELNLLFADALFDGGRTLDAARQYANTAYERPGFGQAPEAAYASVQAYQRLAAENTGADHEQALRDSVAASQKLAERFPEHPQWTLVLTRAAEDLYALHDHDAAIALAQRVLASGKPLTSDLRSENLGVVADAQFARQRYPQAELAYAELLQALPEHAAQRAAAVDQLAAAVYKQGEAARDAGDLKTAAASFLRVGRVAPQAAIRVNADYDAASAYYQLKDWPSVEATLEDFRQRYPQHALVADADKRLAAAYEQDSKPRLAADAYSRVARRASEAADTRRDAAWLAATRYDQSQQPLLSAQAYEFFLASFSAPLDRGLQARRRLADLSRDDLHDTPRYEHWLGEIIALDSGGGSQRTDSSKQMAAQASLELGRNQATRARALALTLPVERSLPQRRAATEAAIATLSNAAAYGYADVSTAATFELGTVYRDFGRALVDSSRPPELKGEALEQYTLLLEEQAFPFEEKAIQAYEINLGRMRQGLWNDAIHRSARALMELSPAKYGKHDQRDTVYDSLL